MTASSSVSSSSRVTQGAVGESHLDDLVPGHGAGEQQVAHGEPSGVGTALMLA